MTNNSSKSVEDYIKKLARLGIPSVYDDFFTSSQATGLYLQEHCKGDKLYICGTESLKKELMKYGFEITEDVDEIRKEHNLNIKNIFVHHFTPGWEENFGLFIDYFIYDDSFKIDDIITILFAICRNSCMAIQDMYEKYIMDKKYVHPLLMLGSEGIIDSNNGNMFAYNRSYRMCN